MSKKINYQLDEIHPNLINLYRSKPNKNKLENALRDKALLPAVSPLDQVADAFYCQTDIPLKLPMISFLHIVSTHLIRNKCKLNMDGEIINPALWSIVLAESGSGKSTSFSIIEKASKEFLGFGAEIDQPTSDRSLLEMLDEENGRGLNRNLWFQDEYGKLHQRIETLGTPENSMKDPLLKINGGHSFSKTTASYGTLKVDNGCISILGMNTPQDFLDTITEKSLDDGFGQRFTYWYADWDPERDPRDPKYCRYNKNYIVDEVNRAMERISNVELHDEYLMSDDAFELYKKQYAEIMTHDLPISYKKRIAFNCYKTAVCYHIIQEDHTNIIKPSDVAFALRCTMHNLLDLSKMLEHYNYSDLEKIIQNSERVYKRAIDRKGKCTPRDLVNGVRSIRSANEAKQILSMIEEN